MSRHYVCKSCRRRVSRRDAKLFKKKCLCGGRLVLYIHVNELAGGSK